MNSITKKVESYISNPHKVYELNMIQLLIARRKCKILLKEIYINNMHDYFYFKDNLHRANNIAWSILYKIFIDCFYLLIIFSMGLVLLMISVSFFLKDMISSSVICFILGLASLLLSYWIFDIMED